MIRLQLELDLAYEVTDPNGADFVFNIHAAHTAHQTVEQEKLVIDQPLAYDVAADPTTGTRFMRMHANPGPLNPKYTAPVGLRHHRADPATLGEVPVRSMPPQVLPYVYPSRYCQSDRLLRLAARKFGDLPPGYGRVQAVQKWVQQHVVFANDTSNSSTSAVDTLVDQAGVCRDFAHRWCLFGASGTAIPAGFMRFGTGRDAADVAFATIFGGVVAMAPRIQTLALQGPGLEAPAHGAEALSTAAG